MKKTLAILLALCMMVGLFAGCNTDSGTATTTKASAATTTKANPATTTTTAQKENFNPTGYPIVDEPITVSCTITNDGTMNTQDPNSTLYWKTLAEITNINIEWNFLENDASVTNLYYAAGDFTDFTIGTLTVDRVQQWGVEGGAFADISDLVEEYMPHMMSRLAEWPDMLKVCKQEDGSMYSIPQVRLGTTAAAGQMYYRTDYLAALGVEEPSTPDEFYDVLVKAKESGLTQGFAPLLAYGASQYYTTGGRIVDYFLPAFGGSLQTGYDADENGKVFSTYTTDAMERYVAYMAKLYDEGLIDAEQFTLDSATFNARVKAGQAMFMDAASNLQPEDCIPNDGKVHLSIVEPLTSEWNSEKRIAAYKSLSTSSGGIKADSPYVREILRMLDIGYAKEEIIPGSGMDAVACNSGPKGIAYTVDDATNTYAFVVPAGETEKTGWTMARWYYGWNVKYGVYDMTYSMDVPNSLARETAMMTKNVPYAQTQFPSYLLKYEEFEKTSIATQETDINNYYQEMIVKFITGIEPLSNWDNYCQEIEKMGMKDVLSVVQAAYDRWLAL